MNKACSSPLDLFSPVSVCTMLMVSDSRRKFLGRMNYCTVGGLTNFLGATVDVSTEETNGPWCLGSDIFNSTLTLHVITYGCSKVLGAIYCLGNMTMQLVYVVSRDLFLKRNWFNIYSSTANGYVQVSMTITKTQPCVCLVWFSGVIFFFCSFCSFCLSSAFFLASVRLVSSGAHLHVTGCVLMRFIWSVGKIH